jgi:hypothetical protein
VIKIKRAENGAVLTIDNSSPFVFKFDEEQQSELKDLLYAVGDELCLTGRYSAQRININLVHGDKHVCVAKKCEICRGES